MFSKKLKVMSMREDKVHVVMMILLLMTRVLAIKIMAEKFGTIKMMRLTELVIRRKRKLAKDEQTINAFMFSASLKPKKPAVAPKKPVVKVNE